MSSCKLLMNERREFLVIFSNAIWRPNIFSFMQTDDSPSQSNTMVSSSVHAGLAACWKNIYKNICFKYFVDYHPWESNAADCVSQHVSENWRKWISRREIRVKPWMLPMRNSRHNLRLNVFHNCLPRLGLHWSLSWNQITQITRLYWRRHSTILQRFQVLANVLDHFRSALSKVFAVHPELTLGSCRKIFFKFSWLELFEYFPNEEKF